MQSLRGLFIGAICALAFAALPVRAQTNSFKQTNLVSDTAGLAPLREPDLLNPWGVAFLPGQSFMVAINQTGSGQRLDRNGVPNINFVVPPPRGSSNQSSPAGIVANFINGTVAGFEVNRRTSLFIFDTEDGTISGWNGVDTDAILAVDNSGTGAVYKGLALVGNDSGNFILATNFTSGNVEAYNAGFSPTALAGTPFEDPTLPRGFAPFGIHVITNNQVVVTYAQQDALRHDPIHAPGAGFVSLFDANGNFIRRLASQGTLNAPWGATIAPATFGSFPGALLIGNFGDGTINAFNLTTGAFLGQLKDSNGAVITNPSLWELLFDPNGTTGALNTLYITAGLADAKHGLFAAITPNVTPAATPDFSIGAAPGSMTVTAGQPAAFTVTVTSLNGFSSGVNLSCSGLPINSTCSFTPLSVTPDVGGMVTSTLNVTTNSSPYHVGQLLITMANTRTPGYAALLLIAAIVTFALLLAHSGRYRHRAGRNWVRGLAYSFGIIIAGACLLGAGGCGYSSSNAGRGTQRGTTTVMVTGTSGSLSHSTSVTLTVQ
jgi:uncharacterized protein (TIGR03118 family)